MKRALCVLSLVIWANPGFATTIKSQVTGADMSGMKVMAYFAGGGTETLSWVATSANGTVPFQEGYAGGVFGSGWSLVQQGDTYGDITSTRQLLGVWTLKNDSADAITKLAIDALSVGIVFDIVDGVEETPGSNVGRPFTPESSVGLTYMYSNQFIAPDLYSSLTLDWQAGFTSGNSLRFMADTDSVPEPETALLLLSGLLGIAGVGARARSKQNLTKREV